ncbi:MAG: class I SAM-dependent methyltransferase [Terriglobales bacterium]
MSHKKTIQEEFTRQAERFAASPVIKDEERLRRLVEAIDPPPGSRALDVACGPGYLVMALAKRCREAVGVDLTAAPLAIAERLRRERGVENVCFQLSDADRLPFPEGEFDIVTCRLAFHHMEDPDIALREMARVCRAGGLVAVEDLFNSEDPERAEFHHRVQRLRDSSHTRALPLSELTIMFGKHGLEIETIYTSALVHKLDDWLDAAHTPPDKAAEVREIFTRDERENLSCMSPFRRDGELWFRDKTVALVARKLA